jgi:16S rRNA (cytidine1402-2'-O)-methyltransferase
MIAEGETGGGGVVVPGGSLYVVATPIGNLADLTERARQALASSARVLAEDTRVTATLLRHCGIATRPTSLHEHNEQRRIGEVLGWLAAGEQVALVSDAGTPGISDPGARLVRAAHDAGHRVVPIPGASAVAAAVSAAGLVAERFVFAGFLPAQAKARSELLATLAPLPFATVVYEAPHRVRATLAALREAFGDERPVVIARELTKRFEELARVPLGEAQAWIAADANRERGEFVLVVDAAPADAQRPAELDAEVERWLAALVGEMPVAAAARVVAAVTGVPREQLYERAVALKKGVAE